MREGVKYLAFFQPSHYWSGEPVPMEFFDDIKGVCDVLRAEGAACYINRVDVTPFLKPVRIDTETGFRNHCVDELRELGFEDILIVDGDELWVPGTLSLVQEQIDLGARAISVGMIPVVGLPPYPVEGALDTATVYIGPGVRLRCCRSPECPLVGIKKRLIYHFTGTRPSMDATVLKHKRSGHYDDPAYDYDGWLKDRLPNLKPGDKNIHFYRAMQIWPSLREWKPGELEKMPVNVQNLCRTNTEVSTSPATSLPARSEPRSSHLGSPGTTPPST